MTFPSAQHRDYYVDRDPAHSAFKDLVGPWLDKVVVVDFVDGVWDDVVNSYVVSIPDSALSFARMKYFSEMKSNFTRNMLDWGISYARCKKRGPVIMVSN